MTKQYYLKEILPDGYGLAVNPMMKEPNNLDAHGRDMLQQLVDSLPTVLVHPSLASTLKVGNWFEGELKYQHHSIELVELSEADTWFDCNESAYNSVDPKNRRIVLIPLPSTDAQAEKGERFKRPTDEQVIKAALVFNDGKLDTNKLADMVALAQFIIDRLYENGDMSIPSSKENNNGNS